MMMTMMTMMMMMMMMMIMNHHDDDDNDDEDDDDDEESRPREVKEFGNMLVMSSGQSHVEKLNLVPRVEDHQLGHEQHHLFIHLS
eukprot:1597164-Karenia_brevis.AAC.1